MTHASPDHQPLFRLLDRPVSEDDLNEWTRQAAAPRVQGRTDVQSALIFRVATEWVALPATLVLEIVGRRLIHRLPHRSNDVVVGLVNVRGRLLPLVTPARFLNALSNDQKTVANPSGKDRIIVINEDQTRLAIVADEVHGIYRFSTSEVMQPPLTLTTTGRITGILSWKGKTVGQIHPKLLLDFFRRYLA